MSDIVLANAVVLLAAFVQGAAGIGFAMIAVPCLALIDLSLVPGPAMIALLALASIMAAQGRASLTPRDFVWLLPGIALGSAIGAWLLNMMPEHLLAPALGATILIAVAGIVIGLKVQLRPGELLVGGSLVGIMGTAVGIHGPPLAVLYANAPPARARAMIAWSFMIASILSLSALALSARVDGASITLGLGLLPGLLVGLGLAQVAIGRVPAAWLRTGMLIISTITALMLLGRAAG